MDRIGAIHMDGQSTRSLDLFMHENNSVLLRHCVHIYNICVYVSTSNRLSRLAWHRANCTTRSKACSLYWLAVLFKFCMNIV